MIVLGIDQGTTGTKAVRLGQDGTTEVVYRAEHRQIRPSPGWVEHDPEELLGHIRAAVEAGGSVDAIGLANQGETVIAFDIETGRAIYNAIVWLDARTEPLVSALSDAGKEAVVRRRAGLPLESYFSATKLAWLVEKVPEAKRLLAQGRLRLGTSDAFFLYRLTGRFVTDVATASRTSLMDLRRCVWDPALCDLFGVPVECLPEILPSVADFGRVNGVPITAGIVDQQAGLFGHGCRRPGDLKFTFGTGGFCLALTGDKPVVAAVSGLLPTVAWQLGEETLYALDGGIYNACSAIDWAQRLGLFTEFDEISQFDGPSALERGIVFVPGLSGLACPHWDRRATGVFIGMGLETERIDLARAVVEGIALEAATVLRSFDWLTPLGDTVSIDGGLARNPYFCQFLAAATGRRIRVFKGEATAIGAARLARKGMGGGEVTPTGTAGAVYEVTTRIPRALIDRYDDAVRRGRHWQPPA